MELEEKLDLIIKKLDENKKILDEILKLTREDTPGREFLLSLGADLAGNILYGGG